MNPVPLLLLAISLPLLLGGCEERGVIEEGTYVVCGWKDERYEGYLVERTDDTITLESIGVRYTIPIKEIVGMKVFKPSYPDYEVEMGTKPPRK